MPLQPVWLVALSAYRCDASPFDESSEAASRTRVSDAILEFQRSAKSLHGRIELLVVAGSPVERMAVDLADDLGIALHLFLPMPIAEFIEHRGLDDRGRQDLVETIAKANGLQDLDRSTQLVISAQQSKDSRVHESLAQIRPGWSCRVSTGSFDRDSCYFDCDAMLLESADACVIVSDAAVDPLDTSARVPMLVEARSIPSARIFLSEPDRQYEIAWGKSEWHSDSIISELDRLVDEKPRTETKVRTVNERFDALDAYAIRTGSRFRNRSLETILCQFAATIVALINSLLLLPNVSMSIQEFKFEWNATTMAFGLFAIELGLVTLAYFLSLTSTWSKVKARWLRSRMGAEILRSLLLTRGLIDPLFPIVGKQNPRWYRFALSSGIALHNESPSATGLEELKASYHRDRLLQQRDRYFRRKLVGASRLSRVCSVIAKIAGGLAPVCILLAMYLKLMHGESLASTGWGMITFRLLPVVLPLLAGTANSLKAATDAGRRAERYVSMAHRLESHEKWFLMLSTPSSIRRSVHSIEEMLLDELDEWYVVNK